MMSEREGLPDWVDQRARKEGPPDREIRFRAAARRWLRAYSGTGPLQTHPTARCWSRESKTRGPSGPSDSPV